MSTELMSVLDDILECSVCLNRLQDPKILPCGHVFCKKCLVPLRTKVCPKCRQNFSKSVADLPTDTTTVKLLESCRNGRACRNCESTFSIQCYHCTLKLCETCLKKHMSQIFLEKHEFLRANLPDDIIQSNQAQFRAEVMSRVNNSIEAAREKATTYLNFHFDEVGRIWQQRMDNWNDFSLLQNAYNDVCYAESFRNTTSRGSSSALSVLYESHEKSDQAVTAIGKLHDDLDSTISELIALQWKLNRNSAKSRKVLEVKLDDEKQAASKKTRQSSSATSTTVLAKAMDETSDEEENHLQSSTQDSGAFGTPSSTPSFGTPSSTPSFGTPSSTPSFRAPPSTPSFRAPPSTPSFRAPPSTPSFGAPSSTPSFGAPCSGFSLGAPPSTGLFGTQSATNQSSGLFGPSPAYACTSKPAAKAPTTATTAAMAATVETTDSTRHGVLDKEGRLCRSMSFEEERFGHVKKTRSKQTVKDGSSKDCRNTHITLYSHRVTGLFTTPPLTFSLLNTLTHDQPAKFPAEDDDDEAAKFPTPDDDGEPAKFPADDDDEKDEKQNQDLLEKTEGKSPEENEDSHGDDSGDDGEEVNKPSVQDAET